MSEEDLRIQQIRMKVKDLTFEQARDISNLCSEYYIEGLEQSRFDKRMLEVELSGYRQAILQDKELMGLKEDRDKLQNNWKELKKWLIQLQKFKGINQQGFSWGVAQEVLDKMQELEQGKDE